MDDHDNFDEGSEKEGLLNPGVSSKDSTRYRWLLAVSAVFFLAGAIMLSLSFKNQHRLDLKACDMQLSSYTTAWTSVAYEDVQFDAALFTKNRFKGPPSPALDRAWESIIESNPLRIPSSAFERLHKDVNTSVQFPDEAGGYMAGLEVFHQLHCLRLVRQFTYQDYYSNLPTPPQAFTDSQDTLRLHIDHCIDMVRQVLMCHADITLVTHSWVDNYDKPFPDFNTWHKCRNFDLLSEYAKEVSVEMDIRRPGGAKQAGQGHTHH